MMLPHSYNNGKQIQQSGGYVTILSEMVHEARIIPLGDRPRLAQGTQAWTGYSSGHWQGNTLVVRDAQFQGGLWLKFVGIQTESLSTIEWFTPVSPQTLMYRVTIEDPTGVHRALDRGVSLRTRRRLSDLRVCVPRGQWGDTGLLRGARAEERVKSIIAAYYLVPLRPEDRRCPRDRRAGNSGPRSRIPATKSPI